MPENIHLTIDDQFVTADAGATILKTAQKVGILIPTICFHDYCTANALCRICVVEVEGSRTLVPACIGLVSEGMEVHTQSEKVRSARRTILEMLASSVDLSEALDIQAYIQEYQADPARYPQSDCRSLPVIDDNPMFIRDYAKCILCWRCVQVCGSDAQYAYAINFNGRGYETQISTFYEISLHETTCVFCGQCIGVCPTGALKPKRQFLLELGYTENEIMALARFERKQKPRQVILPGGQR